MPVNSRLISYGVGGLLLASGLLHLAILLGSGGTWAGPLSLRKPMVFGLSFGVTLITITWVASFLNLSDRARLPGQFHERPHHITHMTKTPGLFSVAVNGDRLIAKLSLHEPRQHHPIPARLSLSDCVE